MSEILKPTLGLLAVLAWSGASLCAGEAKAPADPKAAESGKTAVIVPAGSTQRAAAPEALTSVDFKGENLKVVLDFLSTRSNLNIRALDDKDLENIKVTFSLDNVSWREILNFLAEKYGLMVDDSRELQGVIVVKSPPKVSIITWPICRRRIPSLASCGCDRMTPNPLRCAGSESQPSSRSGEDR